jgi:hypothetical protein
MKEGRDAAIASGTERVIRAGQERLDELLASTPGRVEIPDYH